MNSFAKGTSLRFNRDMLKQNILLKEYTNYKIGGPAKYFLEIHSLDDLENGVREWEFTSQTLEMEARKTYILGGGTNVLFDDRGFNGLVIYNAISGIERISEHEVKFGSGMQFKEALNFALETKLSGLEWGGGLPGSVGGAIRGNAGAFGGEIKDTIVSVESIDIKTFQKHHRSASECQFGYRSSIFKQLLPDELITSGTFFFEGRDEVHLKRVVKEHEDYREERQPLDFPSAGSTFKNVPLDQVPLEWQEKFADQIKNDPFPVMPVAWLLSEAGLKGKQVGGAKISEKHPNFFINTGGASSVDLKELLNYAQKNVKEKFNILIEPEIIIVEY
ncbi:MAG TPA: UDP-N-acetylmuramate dehydrogenase [bacterium]|nr:UDP-N-acetylmuramate dehydrogenase [bacterium]